MIPRLVRSNLTGRPQHIDWPEWPKAHQRLSGALFEERPALRKLTVLVDAELLASPDDFSLTPEALLTGLLTHPYIKLLRYRDDGPFPDVPRKRYGPAEVGTTAAEGWAELRLPRSDGTRDLTYTYGDRVTYTGVLGNWIELGQRDTAASASRILGLTRPRKGVDAMHWLLRWHAPFRQTSILLNASTCILHEYR